MITAEYYAISRADCIKENRNQRLSRFSLDHLGDHVLIRHKDALQPFPFATLSTMVQ